jgi:hypothetical protein
MKKIIVLMFLLAVTAFSESVEAYIDYSFADDYSFKNGETLNKSGSDLGLSLEIYDPVEDNLKVGWGLSQIRGKVDVAGSHKVNLTTAYFAGKYYLSGKEGTGFFFKFQGGGYLNRSILGKTSVSGLDLDNGYYYSYGIGGEMSNFILQFMYNNYIGNATINGDSTKLDYGTGTLSFGYLFDLK